MPILWILELPILLSLLSRLWALQFLMSVSHVTNFYALFETFKMLRRHFVRQVNNRRRLKYSSLYLYPLFSLLVNNSALTFKSIKNCSPGEKKNFDVKANIRSCFPINNVNQEHGMKDKKKTEMTTDTF